MSEVLTSPISLRSFFGRVCLIALSLVAFGSLRASAQCGNMGQLGDVTNSGTEFLLVFEQNDETQPSPNDGRYLDVYFAAQDQDAIITLTSKRYPAMHRVINLAAHQSYTYHLSVDTVQYHGVPKQADTLDDLWVTSNDVTDSRVVHVISTSSIVCYGMNHKTNTTDAFLALPVQTAGVEYRIMSYPTSTLNDLVSARGPEFAVAAFRDGTVVTITPSDVTASGDAAGVPLTFTLSAGQCVQIQTNPLELGRDLTGSSVRATQPVAVYGGHSRAEVPVGYYKAGGGTSRNILTEAMPPVVTWGRSFILDAFNTDGGGRKHINGDLMRILALNDNTAVTVNGTPWVTLRAGGFADSLIKGPVVVEASGPSMLAEYSHTSELPDPADDGDPFMAIVPPVDQTFNNYTFFASDDNSGIFTSHFVTIVADTTCVTSPTNRSISSISFDGTPLLPVLFKPLTQITNNRKFAIAQLGVQPGPHTLVTDFDPAHAFTILMYGFGPVDAYGYSGGLLLKPKRAIMANNFPTTFSRRHSNVISFHNITTENVIVDAAKVVLDHPEDAVVPIHIRENIVQDLGPIPGCTDQTLHLVADGELKASVSGTVRIACETPSWNGLDTLVIPFTLFPESLNAVGSTNDASLDIQTYPNPFIATTTFSFVLPEASDVSLKIFDALGHTVRVLAEKQFPQGSYNVTFDRGSLPAGCYTYAFQSRALGLTKHGSLVIGQ